MGNIVVIEITENMKKTYYRQAKSIARHLRLADHNELTAALSCLPEDDVMQGYETSTRKWMIIDFQGSVRIPIALFGVQDYTDEGVGIPWMVATRDLTKIKRFIMKNYGKYLDIMKERYDLLVNFVDARNTDSIKWLKHIGFTFDEAQPYGHEQRPFHRFYMECK